MPSEYVKKRKFPKKETAFIKEFIDEFKKLSGDKIWSFKTHGEPMQARGIPDVLMCYCGLFVGIEFKIMRGGSLSISPYQEYQIELINKSSGLGLVVWYDENNQECGVNMKRFENKKVCAKFLYDLLQKYTEIPPCKYTEIRENDKK